MRISLLIIFFLNLECIARTCHDVVPILKSYLPFNPIILEAGAEKGGDTLELLSAWPEGSIHAFEPLPVLFDELKSKTQNYTNITCYPCALSNVTGTSDFYVGSYYLGASSLLPPTSIMNGFIEFEQEPITVSCITIDEWAKKEQVSHIDFMWLDMEGAELMVLSKSLGVLSTVKAILIEVNFREFRENNALIDDIKLFLEGYCFEEVWSCSIGENWQANVLFIRKDSFQ